MSKDNTLLTALGTVLALQRWNFLPRIETWVEAENAVYVTHVGYAIGRSQGMTTDHLLCFMHRNLLKSLSKHFTTDISVPIRERIVELAPPAWERLLDDNARNTAGLFPREFSRHVASYLGSHPTYPIASKDTDRARKEIEALIEYAHNRVASEECKVNQNAFPSEYGEISTDIERRIARVPSHAQFTEVYSKMAPYFVRIKGLKYLRRWNRINRVIPTSVLAHTYLVTMLAVVICWLEDKRIKDNDDWTEFQYRVALRALFHDLPESFTGDVITPVKERISAIDPSVWPAIEKALTGEFIDLAAPPVREDIAHHGLLNELDDSQPFTVDSLVKDCDRLALVLECAYERDSGRLNAEMISAYESYVPKLQRSEWRAVREFVVSIAAQMKQ